jgi:hypothetical protein
MGMPYLRSANSIQLTGTHYLMSSESTGDDYFLHSQKDGPATSVTPPLTDLPCTSECISSSVGKNNNIVLNLTFLFKLSD